MSIKTDIQFHNIGINDLLHTNKLAIAQLAKQVIYVITEKNIANFIKDGDARRQFIEMSLKTALETKVKSEVECIFDEIKTIVMAKAIDIIGDTRTYVTKLEYDETGNLIDIGVTLKMEEK